MSQFTVKDAAGSEIYQSGFLRPYGRLDPGAHSFTNRPVDATGSFVDNQQHRIEDAMAQFKALQAIDPDDVRPTTISRSSIAAWA